MSDTPALPTLEQLNARCAGYAREWDKYTLQPFYAVGSQSRRWSSSPKTHLLRCERVIEDREPKKGTYGVGDIFSAAAPCNGNGQHTGTVYGRSLIGQKLDTNSITCERCLKRLQQMA